MEKGVWVRAHCPNNAACVEVRVGNHIVFIRSASDTMVIALTSEEWRNFRAAIKAGQFD